MSRLSDLTVVRPPYGDLLCFSRSLLLSALLYSAELSRFTVRKATPRRILNAAAGHAPRPFLRLRLSVYSHVASSAFSRSQSVLPPAFFLFLYFERSYVISASNEREFLARNVCNTQGFVSTSVFSLINLERIFVRR